MFGSSYGTAKTSYIRRYPTQYACMRAHTHTHKHMHKTHKHTHTHITNTHKTQKHTHTHTHTHKTHKHTHTHTLTPHTHHSQSALLRWQQRSESTVHCWCPLPAGAPSGPPVCPVWIWTQCMSTTGMQCPLEHARTMLQFIFTTIAEHTHKTLLSHLWVKCVRPALMN